MAMRSTSGAAAMSSGRAQQLARPDLVLNDPPSASAAQPQLNQEGYLSSDAASDVSSPTTWTSDVASDDSKTCRHTGCTNAVRSRGRCLLHGGGAGNCSYQECNRSAASDGINIARGGGERCANPGCISSAVSRGLCVQHGGGRKCKHDGCTKHVASSGLCRAHGGGRRCKVPDCTSSAQSRGLCYVHGGGGRCQQLGCASSAKKGGYCIAHGGGHRCQVRGCTSSAVSGDLCRAHGGGKRCAVAECKSSAKTGGLCIAHGGGKRCTVEGCKSSAQRLGLCKAHGGGRKCVTPGCVNSAVSRGKCIAHGGGKRCIQEGCSTTARRGGYCFAHGGRAPPSSAGAKRLGGSCLGSGSKRERSRSAIEHERPLIRKPGMSSVAPMPLTPKPTPGSTVGLPMTPPLASQPLRPRLPSMSLLLSKQDSVRDTECIPPIRSAFPTRRYSSDLEDEMLSTAEDTLVDDAKSAGSDSPGYSWRCLQETVMLESKAEGLDSVGEIAAKNGAEREQKDGDKSEQKSTAFGQHFASCA